MRGSTVIVLVLCSDNMTLLLKGVGTKRAPFQLYAVSIRHPISAVCHIHFACTLSIALVLSASIEHEPPIVKKVKQTKYTFVRATQSVFTTTMSHYHL